MRRAARRGRGIAAALAAGLAAAHAGCGPAPAPERAGPDVLLVTLDTTRADRLGCYGHDRPTSPNIDRLARESVLYSRAVSNSSWTLPAHASLFTGKVVTAHGARYDAQGPLHLRQAIDAPESWDAFRVRGLSPRETTLAGLLAGAGYATAGIVAGPWMKRIFGLDRGFDDWDDDGIGDAAGRRADSVTSAALHWIDAHRAGPFFLFLNYYDPHGPFAAPAPLTYRFLPGGPAGGDGAATPEEELALYDAEILFMDQELGRLLDGLRRRGLYDDMLVVVLADHGELFGEHGRLGHGKSLYREELHVPFLVKYPGGAGAATRSDLRIQTIDVLPLVLDRVGLAPPPGIQGGLPPAPGHPIVAETYPLEALTHDGHWRALYDADYKFLWNSLGDHQLFDLARDPAEETNLAAREPQRVAALAARLEAYLAALPAPEAAGPDAPIDADTRRALESLGYVQ